MRIANVVHGVPFGKVNEGNIIQFFDRDGKLYTGIKICCEKWKGVLFLKAPPPYKRAGIFPLTDESHPWDQDLMLEFPDAMLLSKEFDQLPVGHKPCSGDLTMHHDGKIKLLSEPSGGVLYVDMRTGQVSPPDDGAMSPLIVSKWAIVLKGNTSKCLVEFPEESARESD